MFGNNGFSGRVDANEKPVYNEMEETLKPEKLYGIGAFTRLEPLAGLTSIKIHQDTPDCLELFGCWEFNNVYQIQNEAGKMFWQSKEESSWLQRSFCSNVRAFDMPVYDLDGTEVLRFKRPLKCFDLGCSTTDSQCLEVYSGEEYLGKVVEYPTCYVPKWKVLDATDKEKLEITGPSCGLTWCRDADFPVTNENGDDVGDIHWYFKGWESIVTDTDVFSLTIPGKMPRELKALLLGAVHLIDFMHFEAAWL